MDRFHVSLLTTKYHYIMRKSIICLTALSLLTISCTTDPYTGERTISKTALLGGGGVLAGALAGQLAGGDTKSTLIGAAAGGAVGAGAGYYLDNQEAKLRAELKGTGVGISRTDNKIKLIMPGNITFASNSYNINASFYDVLNSVSKVLEKYKKTNIAIIGYTDSTGKDADNQALSLNRANSVASYLKSQGLDFRRVKTYGLGSDNPIASNATSNGRSQNRRVEIEIVPIN